jgi:hypothetical protein
MKTLWIPILLLATPITGMSQVLLIDAIQDEQRSSLPRPMNGATMSEVEHQFGAPRSRHGPVGDPPIVRWDYAEFTVYFEYDKVLTTVLKRNKVTSAN